MLPVCPTIEELADALVRARGLIHQALMHEHHRPLHAAMLEFHNDTWVMAAAHRAEQAARGEAVAPLPVSTSRARTVITASASATSSQGVATRQAGEERDLVTEADQAPPMRRRPSLADLCQQLRQRGVRKSNYDLRVVARQIARGDITLDDGVAAAQALTSTN
jgi:hypothetical protein